MFANEEEWVAIGEQFLHMYRFSRRDDVAVRGKEDVLMWICSADVAAVIHLGRALCGHDGIIHGGIISTVFDESLARNVSLASPEP